MSTVTSDGIELYYEDHGDRTAEPVLLIMGFIMNAGAWAPQIEALAPRYHVIAFDNRGSGRSAQPPGPYNMREFVADTAAVLDAAGADSAHIIGVSMGGMIAQQFTLAHPDRVRSLILMATTPGGPHSYGYDTMRTNARELDDIATIEDAMGGERLGEFARQLFTEEFLAAPGAGFAQMVGSTMQHPSTLDGMRGQMAAIVGHDVYDRLPEIHIPTLVLSGSDDVMVDARNAPLLAQRIPGAELREFPGLRHGFAVERPDEINPVILEFLARQRATAA